MSVSAVNLYIYYGRREFSTEKNYVKEYSEGQGGLNIYLIIGPSQFYCYADIYYTPFSQGNVEVTGLSRIRYTMYRNGVFANGDNFNFVSPVSSWYAPNSIDVIFQNDNITVVGNAIVKFQINEIVYNETFNYVITLITPINVSGGLYTQQLPLVWVEFFLILGILVLSVWSISTVNKIRTEVRYTKEMKEEDEEFFRYLKERKKQ